jgi:hypothetical protein
MAGSPLRGRIGEHGHFLTEKGAGFYLYREEPFGSLKKEIKTAPAEGHFAADDPRFAPTGDQAPFQEPLGRVVGSVGVEHHRAMGGFDGYDGIRGSSTFGLRGLLEEQFRSREE